MPASEEKTLSESQIACRVYNYSQNSAYFITICTEGRKHCLSQIVGDDAHIRPNKYYKKIQPQKRLDFY